MTKTSPNISRNLIFKERDDEFIKYLRNKLRITSSTGGGVTDHSALTGLLNDDHPQYLTEGRGDIRYATALHTHSQSDITGLVADLANKSNVGHSHVISDVTGLQTALDSKQAAGSYAAAVHTHSISDVTGLQTALDSKAFPNIVRRLQDLGSAIKFAPVGFVVEPSVSQVLADGLLRVVAVDVYESATVTGVKFLQRTQGNYVADNENSVSLFSYSSGTLTRIAVSANDGNIFKGAAGTWQTVPFTSTVNITPGVYYVGVLWNAVSTTTIPALLCSSVPFTGNWDFTNSAKLWTQFTTSSSTGPFNMSSGTDNVLRLSLFLY